MAQYGDDALALGKKAKGKLDDALSKGKKKACACPKDNKKTKGTSKTVDDLIKNAKPGDSTKGRSTIYELSGGFEQALKDFNSLEPQIIKSTPELQVGKLKDGRTVIVREESTDGRVTLEIQKGKKKIKFRYN
ncbi:hypothetical protein CHM34_17895 [Paludifilum halophilum]|uniref:Pre-toxin TG domain-containing protein n=1 Tax=Paludifilum halophilum TaxID=1642702 RepID=A0A235B2J7_9BACL|nr:hypothetical protein CHM34_17895 [Paludifilum halophilum]